jgi:hypothetical protein
MDRELNTNTINQNNEKGEEFVLSLFLFLFLILSFIRQGYIILSEFLEKGECSYE